MADQWISNFRTSCSCSAITNNYLFWNICSRSILGISSPTGANPASKVRVHHFSRCWVKYLLIIILPRPPSSETIGQRRPYQALNPSKPNSTFSCVAGKTGYLLFLGISKTIKIHHLSKIYKYSDDRWKKVIPSHN